MSQWDLNQELYEDYLKVFKNLNINTLDVETLNRFDQIHAGGISSTKKIAELIDFKKGQKVLELGGGIGGVARFLAKNFAVSTYNLDLSYCYSLTGLKLNNLIKEKINVYYVNGDANHIPFFDGLFDIVWLQHINMNIPDKKNFLREIKRVTKKTGQVVFHEWFIKDYQRSLLFPLPWSDNETYNFLITFEDFLSLLKELGFKIENFYLDTENALAFYKKIYQNRLFNNPIFKKRDGEKIFKNMISLIEDGTLLVYYGKLVP